MKQSAGILVFRHSKDRIEVLLTHPGGPIWGKRGVWSIPKGQADSNEDLQDAARREFNEELNLQPPSGTYISLGSEKQGTSKINHIWAVESDIDIAGFASNTFSMEWPPKSGTMIEFPENDRAVWFELAAAKQKLFPAQVVFIDRLADFLHLSTPSDVEQQKLL